MLRVIGSLLVLLFWLPAATNVVGADGDTCIVTGDINGDGIPYEITDLAMLRQFVIGEGPPPDPLYVGDINADGFLDDVDVAFMDSVIQGLLMPPVPNLVGCDPDTLRGACFIWDTCLVFSAPNCFALNGQYVGDGMPCDSSYCFADGDINFNDIAYEIADRVYLAQFVAGEGPPPDPLYKGDLNADGYIDQGDVAFLDSVIYGYLPPQFFILTVCDPDTTRGACWDYDDCVILSPENCAAVGDVYVGDGTSCEGPCYATGDVNRNGIAFEISDWAFLASFIIGYGPPPDPLYEGDLNADGFIDEADVAYLDSVVRGDLPPPADPILTDCYPDTIRGACDEGDTCFVRAPANCAAAGGAYAGNGTLCYCYAGGDINVNGIAFEIGDWVLLMNFIHGWASLPVPLHEADLNADGFVDDLDAGYMWGVIDGSIAPNAPILTGCDPDIVRGGCQMGDTCLVLAPDNCTAAGGIYEGDGIYCYCYADGDVNGNGIAFEIGDWVLLMNFVWEYGPPPDPLYNGDLNADGYIDDLDVGFIWQIIVGNAVPPETPFLVSCNPDTIRGGCQMGDTCLVLAPDNCTAAGGSYQEDGIYCYCYANGDINGDGAALTVADMVYLIRFVYYGAPPPDPLNRGDLNTDGYIDAGDCVLLDSLITYEQGSPWWYTPTSCYPPDTIRGGCMEGDSCVVRSAENCAAGGGTYLGNGISCACDCTGLGDMNLDGTIDPLDAAILANFIYKSWNTRELILSCTVENGDWNCSHSIDPIDMAYCVLYVYLSWGDPPCDPCGQ